MFANVNAYKQSEIRTTVTMTGCIGGKDYLPAGVFAVIVTTIVMSILHIIFGLTSVCIGVISSVQAEVWLAHRVSPIWSGGFVSIHHESSRRLI